MLIKMIGSICLVASGFAGVWSPDLTSAPIFSGTTTGAEFEVTLSANSQNGEVLATWSNNMGFNPMYSFYDGTSWGTPTAISGTATVYIDVHTSYNPTGDSFLATWGDSTLMLPAYAIYSSGSWSTPGSIVNSTISNGSEVFNVYDPTRGFFWAAWTDTVTTRPVAAFYNGTWHASVISGTATSGNSVFLAIDPSGNLLAVWQDTGTQHPIYSFFDGGWSAPAEISSTSTALSYVEACYDAEVNGFVAAWVDSNNSNYPSISIYDGTNWGPVTTITTDSTATNFVSLSYSPDFGLLMANWTDAMTSYPYYSLFNSLSWTDAAPISTLGIIVMGFGTYGCYNPVSQQFFGAWANFFVPTYSIYTVTLAPPSSFTGVQKMNNFGVVKERYNALSWQSNPNNLSYNLYRNGTLIATLDGAANSYEDHDQPAQNQIYSLVANSVSGASAPALVIVGGQK